MNHDRSRTYKLKDIGLVLERKLSRSSGVIFTYFFFHLRLFDSVHFQYSQVLVVFPLSKCPYAFLILVILFLLFPRFHYLFRTFFFYKIPFLYPAVYCYCFYQGPGSFSFFCKNVSVIHIPFPVIWKSISGTLNIFKVRGWVASLL